MHFYAIYGLLHGSSYTTEKLNRELAAFFGEEAGYSLREEEGRIFWKGKAVIPRENYLYLPGGRQLPIPVQEEEEDSWRPRERGKQVWVNYPLLYRGDSTGWLWNLEIVGSYVDVQGVGHMVETLRLEEDRAELTRFIVTDDPRRTGTPPGFSTYEADGQITITDVLDYTEVLTIPARLNGKPVAAAYLGGSQTLRHLRSLTVEEGVRKMDFFWGLKSLEQIRLPRDLELVDQPSYMHSSAWFQNQPEGPVYFQNWYLGTKGTPVRRELKLREGTVGVVREADSLTWDSVVLPASLTFIGDHAFSDSRVPPKVICAPGTEALAAAFDPFFGCFEPVTIPERLPDPPEEKLSARGLYDLGLSCQGLRPAVRNRGIPLPPRFRFYQGRWVADVLYHTRLLDGFCYYGVVEVETGKLLEMHKQGSFIPPFPSGDVYTGRHKNVFFHMAEDYLTFCAREIRKGKRPEQETLEQMDLWWYRVLPESVHRELEKLPERKHPRPGRRSTKTG